MKFTYSSGDRPLDGYTIKRGVGHGGFGEVYYALSDGGKEVALKLVRSNLEVELRGVAQCLNLKHPNLVAVYDLKKDAQADSWVIMEYVAGESLSAVIERHPQGVPLDLVRKWFVGLAKAVGYLHDQGIVHRDLKPGNIFIENGQIKIGDYGLSKFISGSQRTAQTESVGTVHYMAPEISTGHYGKEIDIYAAGIILYEMLIGHVPFEGESAGEILMKHLTATPDLSKLPAGYADVVGTALAKNPKHRHASFADMARALDQLGSPASSRPAFARTGFEETLKKNDFAATGEYKPAGEFEKPAAALNPPGAYSPGSPQRTAEPPFVVAAGISARAKVAELCGSALCAALLSGLFAIVWAALDQQQKLAEIMSTFYLMLGSSWAILLPAKFFDNRRSDQWLKRGVMLVMGLGVGAGAAWINGWSLQTGVHDPATFGTTVAVSDPGYTPLFFGQENNLPVLFGYMSYFGVPFFLIRWWKLAERNRQRRFSFYPVLLAGCASYLLFLILWPDKHWDSVLEMQGAVVLTLTSVIVQLVSPWDEPVPRPMRRARLKYA